MGKVLVDGLARVRLCGFALVIDRLAKARAFGFNAKFFELHLRSFLLVVVMFLVVAQVRDQLIQAMRNSDPRVIIVFVYRFNSDFHSIFTLQVTGCDFKHGPNFGVSLNPTIWVR